MAQKSDKSKTRKKAGRKDAPQSKAQTASFGQWFKQAVANRHAIGETVNFCLSMMLLVVAMFILLSQISYIVNGHLDQSAVEGCGSLAEGPVSNWCGRLGLHTAHYFMDNGFGLTSLLIPVFLLQVSMRLLNAYKVRLWKWFINLTLIMVWGSITLSYVEHNIPLPTEVLQLVPFPWGGSHGNAVSQLLVEDIGPVLTFAVLAVCFLLYCVYLTGETISIVRKMFRPQDYVKRRSHAATPDEEGADEAQGEEKPAADKDAPAADREKLSADYETPLSTVIDLNDAEPTFEVAPATPSAPAGVPAEGTDGAEAGPEFEITVPEADEEGQGDTAADVADLEPYDPRADLSHYEFPPYDLLDDHGATCGVAIDMEEQKANKNRIIEVLHSFGVEITSIKATVGPTITLYEITPAPGVRISKIRNLEDDIALSLSANGIRIIAPIPGKGTIGIEVPNAKPQIVSMESLLNSRTFQETKYELPIALGKTITNEVYMVDLAKLPHLLVAGATGQGKSVGLNAIIGSLLYKKHPAELKFVMVDPKKVEFSIYSPLLNHFLAALPDNDEPIITDVHKVVRTLKSLCVEMDNRYDLLKQAKCKNVKEYNAKFKARHLNPNNGHRFMPYIVVIIDEFGDLIMTAGKEVELPIARIAQLARAVGIHMVIATQRPTTTIITGNIKANFPGRMAFKVMQRIDSQTILDRTGANQLVGRGDMLFLAGAEPVRVQCAFLDTPEVEAISEFIGQQQGYLSPYELPEPPADDGGSPSTPQNDEQLDEMFAEVAQWVVASQQGSTSAIQRKFSIGYNRAGRLTDQLEKAGIVSPARGSKPREVLIRDDQSLQTLLEMLQARI